MLMNSINAIPKQQDFENAQLTSLNGRHVNEMLCIEVYYIFHPCMIRNTNYPYK